jgi:hypothetical protein
MLKAPATDKAGAFFVPYGVVGKLPVVHADGM